MSTNDPRAQRKARIEFMASTENGAWRAQRVLIAAIPAGVYFLVSEWVSKGYLKTASPDVREAYTAWRLAKRRNRRVPFDEAAYNFERDDHLRKVAVDREVLYGG